MNNKRLHKQKPKPVNALELPEDLTYREALLTLTGKKELIIENYRGILYYCPERVLILTKKGKLEILGKKMEISYYTAEEMKITGCLLDLHWLND